MQAIRSPNAALALTAAGGLPKLLFAIE